MRNPFHLTTKFIFLAAIGVAVPALALEPFIENVSRTGPLLVQQDDDVPLIFTDAGARQFRARKSGKIVRVEELNLNEVGVAKRVGRRPAGEMPPLPEQDPAMLGRMFIERETAKTEYLQKSQQIVRIELLLVRQLCPDLTPEQRIKIRGAVDAHVDVAADQATGGRQGRLIGSNASDQFIAASIRAAIGTALAENSSVEVAERYRDESVQQATRRKKAAIMQTIAQIDSVLFLSDEQRRGISQKLFEEGHGDFQNAVLHQGVLVPPEVARMLPVFLNGDQLTVWQDLQKPGLQVSRVVVEGAGEDDNWWGLALPKKQEPRAVMRAAPVLRAIRQR